MRSSLIVYALLLGAAQVLAVAVTPFKEVTSPLEYAHHHVHLPLDDYENHLEALESGNMTKRTEVKVCQWLGKPGSGDYTGHESMDSIIAAISNLAAQGSHAASCARKYATSNALSAVYYALSGDCGGQAAYRTIEGALDKWARLDHDWRMRGVFCLKLSHGGTWQGRVVIATKGFDANNFQCSETADYTHCISGGEKDVS